MAVQTELSGRNIRFEVNVSGDIDNPVPVEYEIISGSVTDVAHENYYLPVNQTVSNIIAHGRVVTYNFQGVLLVKQLPWVDFAPMTQVLNLYVGLNRGGTSTNEDYYDEVYHYSEYAVVTQMKHVFDTSTHQVFDVTIVADGSYEKPSLT